MAAGDIASGASQGLRQQIIGALNEEDKAEPPSFNRGLRNFEKAFEQREKYDAAQLLRERERAEILHKGDEVSKNESQGGKDEPPVKDESVKDTSMKDEVPVKNEPTDIGVKTNPL